MDCDKIRAVYQDKKIPPCCESCHEDEDFGEGSDLWFDIDGTDWHVCCAIGRAFEKKGGTQEYLDNLEPLDPRD